MDWWRDLIAWWRRPRIPTERTILTELYDMCSSGGPKNMRGITDFNIAEAAKRLGVTDEFLHDYLTMMDLKYRYKTAENTYRSLYVFRGLRRCGLSVPYAAAILAGHNQEATRYNRALLISLTALIVSIAGVAVRFLPAIEGSPRPNETRSVGQDQVRAAARSDQNSGQRPALPAHPPADRKEGAGSK